MAAKTNHPCRKIAVRPIFAVRLSVGLIVGLVASVAKADIAWIPPSPPSPGPPFIGYYLAAQDGPSCYPLLSSGEYPAAVDSTYTYEAFCPGAEANLTVYTGDLDGRFYVGGTTFATDDSLFGAFSTCSARQVQRFRMIGAGPLTIYFRIHAESSQAGSHISITLYPLDSFTLYPVPGAVYDEVDSLTVDLGEEGEYELSIGFSLHSESGGSGTIAISDFTYSQPSVRTDIPQEVGTDWSSSWGRIRSYFR